MALSDYFYMGTKDWLELSGKVAEMLIKAKTGSGGGSAGSAKPSRPTKSECKGTVQVSGYTRGDGSEVADYERSCPYHHDDKEKKEKREETKDTDYKPIKLKKNFSTNSSVDTSDVKQLKSSLSKMGYYKPDGRAGESILAFNEYPNSNLESAIKNFQRDNGLKVDGTINKGGPTESALNNKYDYHGFSFKDPINADKNQTAVFDGKNLSVYQDGKKINNWDGVAGAKGYQKPELQDKIGKGPLPEGIYIARQSDHQDYYKDTNWFERRISENSNSGKWRGGVSSWGKSRVWIEPSKQTSTYARSGFTVHGGKSPGSAGCIDLTSQMDSFSKWFKNNGKDVIIYVKY